MMIQQLKVKLVKTNVLNTKLFESLWRLGNVWTDLELDHRSFPTASHMHTKCTMHVLFPLSVCLLSFGWLYIDRYGIVCRVGRRALGGV